MKDHGILSQVEAFDYLGIPRYRLAQLLTARSSSSLIEHAGFVLCPDGRYVDADHDIDWAVIAYDCQCGVERWAPGPGEPPWCHGPMRPVIERDLI